MSVDPLVLIGGERALHYVYVQNAPFRLVDPDGLEGEDKVQRKVLAPGTKAGTIGYGSLNKPLKRAGAKVMPRARLRSVQKKLDILVSCCHHYGCAGSPGKFSSGNATWDVKALKGKKVLHIAGCCGISKPSRKHYSDYQGLLVLGAWQPTGASVERKGKSYVLKDPQAAVRVAAAKVFWGNIHKYVANKHRPIDVKTKQGRAILISAWKRFIEDISEGRLKYSVTTIIKVGKRTFRKSFNMTGVKTTGLGYFDAATGRGEVYVRDESGRGYWHKVGAGAREERGHGNSDETDEQ